MKIQTINVTARSVHRELDYVCFAVPNFMHDGRAFVSRPGFQTGERVPQTGAQFEVSLPCAEFEVKVVLPISRDRSLHQGIYSERGKPIATFRRHVMTTFSRRDKDYVPCRECEQCFNRNGERYTMSQVTQKGGMSFPLLQTLHSCQQTKEACGAIYCGRMFPQRPK